MSSPSPVSDHLTSWIRARARSQGLVVWLDGDGHYTEFVESLVKAHTAGAFEVPVVPFRHSFLEQMRALQPHTGGLSPSPVIVHMPGFAEETIRATPTLEVYRAGTRERKALETLVREAAVGHVTPARLDAFLAKPGLTLAKADAWLREAAAQASGELGTWLEQAEPTVVLEAILQSADDRAEGLRTPEMRPVLMDWFERQLGVDAAWRTFVLPIDDRQANGRSAATAHLAPVTHALCVEYVFDLHRAPKVDALAPLRNLDPVLVQRNKTVAEWLRNRHPVRYEQIANDLEGLIRREETEGSPEDLGNIDTFRFEEATLMTAALVALDEGRYAQALDWAEGREAKASFWANQRLERRTAWALIAAGARLGQALVDAQSLLDETWTTQEQALAAYTRSAGSAGWRVDIAHRRLETARAKRYDASLPHYATLRERLDTLRREYRAWADELARKYVQTCRTGGFLPGARARQRSIFRDTVGNLLTAHPKQRVAYFLVDAMRYEMATTLCDELTRERGVDVRLNARLAECPTDTWLGMNVLALDQSGDDAIPLHAFGSGGGVRVGTYGITSPETRRRAMAEALGLPAAIGLTLDESLDGSEEQLAHRIRQARLVVVHSEAIDKAGENGQGLHVFDAELSRLRSAIQRLRAAGVQHFVITADHGFLLHDSTNLRRVPFGKRDQPQRRYCLHPAPASEPGLVCVSPLQLGLTGVEGTLVFLDSTHVFDRGKTKDDFVHGGLSLQERVIPVLEITHRNPRGGSSLTYKLDVKPKSPVTDLNRMSGTLQVEAGNLAFGGDDALDLAVRVPGRTDVHVDLIECDGGILTGAMVRVRVGQPFTLFFRLIGPREEPVRVEVLDPASSNRLAPRAVDAWFPVLSRQAVAGNAPVVAPPPDDWLTGFEDEGTRRIFAHLAKHGSISESECMTLLGGARAFRAFSRDIETHAARAPFTVIVEHAATGKRYVRDGDT